eukprot:TRINITY_DN1918_c0_g1_i1.p2 TRINITY_DN1918_c0_g1~~TRINITY_DN1918_c0_g1_i1.p2  ORF type:complete len:215 (-),score=89.34 TRINITY_DN1918_c0_g1_i1:116-760(-)
MPAPRLKPKPVVQLDISPVFHAADEDEFEGSFRPWLQLAIVPLDDTQTPCVVASWLEVISHEFTYGAAASEPYVRVKLQALDELGQAYVEQFTEDDWRLDDFGLEQGAFLEQYEKFKDSGDVFWWRSAELKNAEVSDEVLLEAPVDESLLEEAKDALAELLLGEDGNVGLLDLTEGEPQLLENKASGDECVTEEMDSSSASSFNREAPIAEAEL